VLTYCVSRTGKTRSPRFTPEPAKPLRSSTCFHREQHTEVVLQLIDRTQLINALGHLTLAKLDGNTHPNGQESQLIENKGRDRFLIATEIRSRVIRTCLESAKKAVLTATKTHFSQQQAKAAPKQPCPWPSGHVSRACAATAVAGEGSRIMIREALLQWLQTRARLRYKS
jgi:hypothetical protein